MDVFLSDHAVARFQECVRPGLDLVAAEVELMAVMRHATVEEEPPSWCSSSEELETVAWALLGDGIAFPLLRGRDGELFAATCIARGSVSEVARQRRQERKRRRHGRARAGSGGLAERNRRWGELRVVG